MQIRLVVHKAQKMQNHPGNIAKTLGMPKSTVRFIIKKKKTTADPCIFLI